MRVHVTKSKAGHYTVTLRDGHRYVASEGYIGTLEQARAIAKRMKEDGKREKRLPHHPV
jgi:hypothetical protein